MKSRNNSTIYQIQVKGKLDLEWGDWFDGMMITVENDITTLQGPVVDQAALYGLILKIRDLGLTLLAVSLITDTKRGRENSWIDDLTEF